MIWFGTVFSSGLINTNVIVAAIPMYKHEAQKILNNLSDSSATLQRKKIDSECKQLHGMQ